MFIARLTLREFYDLSLNLRPVCLIAHRCYFRALGLTPEGLLDIVEKD